MSEDQSEFESMDSQKPATSAVKKARKTARKRTAKPKESAPEPQPSAAEKQHHGEAPGKNDSKGAEGPTGQESPKSGRPPKNNDNSSQGNESNSQNRQNGGQDSSGGDGNRRPQHHFRQQGGGQDGGNRNGPNKNRNNRKKKRNKGQGNQKGGGGGGARRNTPFNAGGVPVEVDPNLDLGQLVDDELLQDVEALRESFEKLYDGSATPILFNDLYNLPLQELRDHARELKLDLENAPSRPQILQEMLKHFEEESKPVLVEGCLEVVDEGFGFVVFPEDSYRLKPLCPFVSEALIEHNGLQRGHMVKVFIQAPRESESCPVVLKIESVMGGDIKDLEKITPFTELTPYYPLDRILLENSDENPENNLSMRVVDLISPIGFGQRGLIVAPPRTGKTVLLQGIANSVQLNYPEAHLIVLLIDERPEEVTDFRRRVHGEVISSTFDETAGSHVHAAELVIEKARRMAEVGRDVIILLDSITRLARAYNTLMPNSGKILSGGVEANALQKPKRFFGSARNIEGGGSITIMGTALVDTGSKMDEVIFEEFKGTGNMELHLDRSLVDKRVFPALAMDRSGTRKEELLYHPDEMQKVYSLRRATKGVPPVEAMEMLIQRVKKTGSNAEFLMTLSR